MTYPGPVDPETEEELPGPTFEGNLEEGVRQGHGKYVWPGLPPMEEGSIAVRCICIFHSASGPPFARRLPGPHRHALSPASRTPPRLAQAYYEGNYKDNKKHGKGFMKFPDGSTYDGEWNMDEMEGEGTYTYANGDVYKGQFLAGKARIARGVWVRAVPSSPSRVVTTRPSPAGSAEARQGVVHERADQVAVRGDVERGGVPGRAVGPRGQHRLHLRGVWQVYDPRCQPRACFMHACRPLAYVLEAQSMRTELATVGAAAGRQGGDAGRVRPC